MNIVRLLREGIPVYSRVICADPQNTKYGQDRGQKKSDLKRNNKNS